MDITSFLRAVDCDNVESEGGLRCIGKGKPTCYESGSESWTSYDCRGQYCPGFIMPSGSRWGGCCDSFGERLCTYTDDSGEQKNQCISSGRQCCGSGSCSSLEVCTEGNTCCRKQSVCGNQCMGPGDKCCDGRICGGGSSTRSTTATSSSFTSKTTNSGSPTTGASSGTSTTTGTGTTGDSNPTSTSDSNSASTSGSTLATDDILSIIQTAVPSEAQTDPASACFLSSDHNAVYTTPDWYGNLPSQAQSYFSSVHAASATGGYCTADAVSDGNGHGSSLSGGAIAGAVIGSIAGALLILGLAFFALRAGWFAACCGGAAGAAAAREDGSEEAGMGGAPVLPSVSAGPEMSGGGNGWGSMSGGSYTRASGMSEGFPAVPAAFPVPVGSRVRDDEGSKRVSRVSRLSRMSRPSTRTVSSVSTAGLPNLEHTPSPPSPVWSKG